MGMGTTQRDENRRCCHARPASREGSKSVHRKVDSSRYGGTGMTGGLSSP